MKNVLNQLENVLKELNPEYYTLLNDPLESEEFLKFESRFNVKLPDDFKALYLWKNGQKGYNSLIGNVTFMSLKGIEESILVMNNLLEKGVIPKENWWNKSWIPFMENGGGDHLCMDIEGCFNGTKGQIVEFWHDNPRRSIVYPDIKSFIECIVITYEKEGRELKEMIEEGLEEEFYLDLNYPTGYPKRII